MDVNCTLKNNYCSQSMQKINFKASPQQILKSIETVTICPGRADFLENLANIFLKFECKMKKSKKLPLKFDYFLSKKNEIPEELMNTKIRTGWFSRLKFKELDEQLTKGAFRCSDDSSCSCGKGRSLGEFTESLLEQIGVDNSEKITITRSK